MINILLEDMKGPEAYVRSLGYFQQEESSWKELDRVWCQEYEELTSKHCASTSELAIARAELSVWKLEAEDAKARLFSCKLEAEEYAQRRLKKQKESKVHTASLVEQLRSQSVELTCAMKESSTWKLKAEEGESALLFQEGEAWQRAVVEQEMLKEAERSHAELKDKLLHQEEASACEYQSLEAEADCLRTELACQSELAVKAQDLYNETLLHGIVRICAQDAQHHETLQCEAQALHQLKASKQDDQDTIELLVNQLDQMRNGKETSSRGSQTTWNEQSARKFQPWQRCNRISETSSNAARF